ncbi:MAG: hypothetical protein J6Z03_07400, partial [Erysipelotrichaceae bacterium]|nr:hypothetical protein [Erysipelotrichaceae bacterium]
ICGYPLQFRYKPSFGLRLYICTNDPEVCGFMSNDLKAGKMQIMKCDMCQDGYLIVKKGSKGYFLGCTNYRDDGKGCNNAISKDKYYEIESLTPDKAVRAKRIPIDDNRLKQNKDLTIVSEKTSDYQKRKYDLKNAKDHGDLYLASKIIISCIDHVSQKRYYGVKKIIDILFGKEIEKSGIDFNQIPEFGVLSKCDREEIEALIYALIRNRYLLKTKEQYPVLHPTLEGKDFIENPDKQKINKVYKDFNK